MRFMFTNTFQSVEDMLDPENEGLGCLLAHDMGLGKTVQVHLVCVECQLYAYDPSSVRRGYEPLRCSLIGQLT
jgi:hypothetical protein